MYHQSSVEFQRIEPPTIVEKTFCCRFGIQVKLGFLRAEGHFVFHHLLIFRHLSSYTKVCSLIYDSWSVPEKSIFSPRETSPVLPESQGRNLALMAHMCHFRPIAIWEKGVCIRLRRREENQRVLL